MKPSEQAGRALLRRTTISIAQPFERTEGRDCLCPRAATSGRNFDLEMVAASAEGAATPPASKRRSFWAKPGAAGVCSIARVEKATTWRCICTLWKTAPAESPSAASPGRAGVSLTRRRLRPDVVRCASAFDVRADSRSAGNARLTLVAPTQVCLLIARSTPAQRTAVLSAPIATCASSRRAVCWRLRSCRRCAQAVGTDRDCCFTQVKRQLRADGSIGSLVLVRQDSLDVDDGLACAGAGAEGRETPG